MIFFANKITLAQLFYYFLSILLSIVLRIVIGTYSMPMIFIGAYKMMGQARLRIADHLRKIPIGWFSSQRSGDLASRLTADLEIIENIWSHFLGMFISTLAMPVFSLTILSMGRLATHFNYIIFYSNRSVRIIHKP
ncbi:siderophore ABC transporter ATP-binding/permease [Proteus mirabilis]|uniref:Siderophore ABC transporter ATP-binding/permease n=1 Tax=Proteus mirabilis TaxID=584 RepID=A0A2X2E7X3_PROMI|nr:siderophore ABC transporter ATP-binding/permease [Proteus mirabilis]